MSPLRKLAALLCLPCLAHAADQSRVFDLSGWEDGDAIAFTEKVAAMCLTNGFAYMHFEYSQKVRCSKTSFDGALDASAVIRGAQVLRDLTKSRGSKEKQI